MFGVASFALLTVLGSVHCRLIVDLTHTLDENAPKYPLEVFGVPDAKYWEVKTLAARYFGDYWLALRTIEFYEHQGTHIDAPFHFGNGRQTLEEIPVNRLVGPGVVIDVREKAKANPDYAITVEDLEEHERLYGRIPNSAIIMMNSGWAEKYPDSNRVFGTANLSDTSSFRFPGWSIEACRMLLTDRQVGVVGVDTPSTDPGQTVNYPCHVYLQPNNVPLLEYVANLDSIPVRNTTIFLGSMKVRRGTGGPTRIFAVIDDDDDKTTSSAHRAFFSVFSLVSTFLVSLFLHV